MSSNLPCADGIYRDDVVFKDPRNTVKGKSNYRRLFKFVRILGRIVFSRVFVRVQRIWQLDDRCISVRWEVKGVPRIPWEVEGVFDGVSYFKLDKCGPTLAVSKVHCTAGPFLLIRPFCLCVHTVALHLAMTCFHARVKSLVLC